MDTDGDTPQSDAGRTGKPSIVFRGRLSNMCSQSALVWPG
jgi:hypothetical protein